MPLGTPPSSRTPTEPGAPLPSGAALVVGKFLSDGVAAHIADALSEMGSRVVRFETGFPFRVDATPLRRRFESVRARFADLTSGLPAARARFTRRLEQVARSEPIGLTIVCHDYLDPREIERVREATGAPIALWFPDAISRFGRAWFLNGPYDALFFKDPYAVDVLRRALDKPVYYLPEAFNPKAHDAPPLTDAERATFGCDICTAGNLYTYRAEFFARLADYDVKLWGHPAPLWMRTEAIAPMVQNRYVANADKARAFRAAKVCINNLNPAEIWGLNARAFEIAGCGGFQLLDWRPALADLFVDGEEVVSFRDMADLRAKLDHYLPREEERRAIAERGRARSLREHTFRHRLALLVDTVLGGASGHPMPRIEAVRTADPR
ncbi:MAG: glycosyltransferase [Myxococcales bacterium]|nr:glycosyltransferase [Myxococcales bacterium]